MKNNMAIKILVYIVFIVLFLGITLFGIGPVLFADGVMAERIITLIIVLIIYVIWFLLFRYILRKIKSKG